MAEGKTAAKIPERITAPGTPVVAPSEPAVEPVVPVPPRIPSPPPMPVSPVSPVASQDFGDGIEELPEQALSPKGTRMRQVLLNDEKIRSFIPLGFNEKQPAYQDVQMNGFRLRIRKGVYVDLPIKVADLLNQSNVETARAQAGETVPNQQGGMGVGANRSSAGESLTP